MIGYLLDDDALQSCTAVYETGMDRHLVTVPAWNSSTRMIRAEKMVIVSEGRAAFVAPFCVAALFSYCAVHRDLVF